jgi:hypothetical protein
MLLWREKILRSSTQVLDVWLLRKPSFALALRRLQIFDHPLPVKTLPGCMRLLDAPAGSSSTHHTATRQSVNKQSAWRVLTQTNTTHCSSTAHAASNQSARQRKHSPLCFPDCAVALEAAAETELPDAVAPAHTQRLNVAQHIPAAVITATRCVSKGRRCTCNTRRLYQL